MSENKVDVILYSENIDFFNMVRDNLNEAGNMNLLGFISSTDELKTKFALQKNALLILNVSKNTILESADLFEYMELSGMKFIAVCEDANIGFEMMKKGALSILVRMGTNNRRFEGQSLVRMIEMKVRDADKIRSMMVKRALKKEVYVASNKIVAIGSSAGGTEAVLEIMKKLPAEIPPMLIIQHMPPVFTRMYADRLNDLCKMTVWEAKDGDKLQPGLALLAPGNFQMKVVKRFNGMFVECVKGEKVNGLAPCIDITFNSVAESVGKNAIGIILTGMGSDGSKGLLNMHSRGAYTIGQDESTSAVYGMPKAAFELGAVDIQLPLPDIAKHIMDSI